MSQIQVTSLESTSQLTTNGSITVGQTTINSTSINLQGSNGVINSTSVRVGNTSLNETLGSFLSETALFVANVNYFPAPLDIFSWASPAGLNNCTISRDTTIPTSPAGGIPFLVTATGSDPHPGTYNSNTWNLFAISPGDVVKTSGYIRIDIDATIATGNYLLNLPANTIGGFGTLTKTDRSRSITAKANEWNYFEIVTTITGSNSGFMQIRPDGYGVSVTNTVANTWYDGITVEKGTRLLVTESVNTQIFTANGTWGKPSWANTGNELVVVHMWGGGGGGSSNATTSLGGGGGAFVFGYYKSSQLGATASVVVGEGGGANVNGGDSSFTNSTGGLFTAYGGGAANVAVPASGGGGGWLSAGRAGTTTNDSIGGGPLPGNTTVAGSTFGGGGGVSGASRHSVYGGGAGGTLNAGYSIFGGGGGSATNSTPSVYGGAGGNNTITAQIPAGGGSANASIGHSGARGEVRVYTYRITG